MFKISKAQLAHLVSVPIVAAFTVGAAWLAKHFPGLPELNNEIVSGAGLAVGALASGVALHYLKGLREWERLEAEGVISVDESDEAPLPADEIPPPPPSAATAAIAELPEPEAPPLQEGGAPGGGD